MAQRRDDRIEDARERHSRRLEDIDTNAARDEERALVINTERKREILEGYLADVEELTGISFDTLKTAEEIHGAALLDLSSNLNQQKLDLEKDLSADLEAEERAHQSRVDTARREWQSRVIQAMAEGHGKINALIGEKLAEGFDLYDGMYTEIERRTRSFVRQMNEDLGLLEFGRRGDRTFFVQPPNGRDLLPDFDMSFLDIPTAAQGGIALSPTLAALAETGPEAIIPLDRLGSLGVEDTQPIEVTLLVPGFEEAVGHASLRLKRRGVR